MVLYGYLTAPQRQSRDAANPGTTQADRLEEHALRFVVFFVQLTNIINGKSANTKTWSRKCAHVQTQRTTASYSLYCRIVWTPFTSRKANGSSPYNQTTNITFPHTHTTDQFKRRAGDTLRCTSNCSQTHSLTYINLPHYALQKPTQLPNYLAIWLHRTQDVATVGCSVGAFF